MCDDCASGSADVDVRHAAWRALHCTVDRSSLKAQHMCRLAQHAGLGCSLEASPEGALACLQDGWLAATDVVHRERLQTLEANVLLLESSLGATHPQASCLRHRALAGMHVCLRWRQCIAASPCASDPELRGGHS